MYNALFFNVNDSILKNGGELQKNHFQEKVEGHEAEKNDVVGSNNFSVFT